MILLEIFLEGFGAGWILCSFDLKEINERSQEYQQSYYSPLFWPDKVIPTELLMWDQVRRSSPNKNLRNKTLFHSRHIPAHSTSKFRQDPTFTPQNTGKKLIHKNLSLSKHHYETQPTDASLDDLDSATRINVTLGPRKIKRRIIRIQTESQGKNPIDQKRFPPKETLNSSNLTASTLDQSETTAAFTQLEKRQLKNYKLYYAGVRRVEDLEEFTDDEGFAVVFAGDSICFRFEIICELGKGTFGKVFKAFDHKRKEMVAIKLIRRSPKYVSQAKVEVKLLEKCQESDVRNNIVELKYSCTFRGHPCLVFELMHQDLYEFCKEIKFVGLSLDLIRRLSIQILQGLLFMEQNRIIHCDLKPENIMFKKEKKAGVKIIDLGSSCINGEQIYNYVQSRYYRAPEIFINAPYDEAIDMWSFGCILVELLNGKPIFSGKDEEEQLAMMTQLLGEAPEALLLRGKRTSRYFEGGSLKSTMVRGCARVPGSRRLDKVLDRSYDPQFVDFVSRFLTWLPEERMKSSEALLHPFITKGLPPKVLEEHLKAYQR